MIPDFFSNWLGDLITLDFFKATCGDIILLKLVPILLSLVEDDGVAEMQQGDIVALEVVVHHTLVDDDLLCEGAVASIGIELEGLIKLVFVIGIVLESFDDWHTSLVGLNDLHGQIFYEVVFVFCGQETADSDCLALVFVVLGVVVLPRQIEEGVSWVSHV